MSGNNEFNDYYISRPLKLSNEEICSNSEVFKSLSEIEMEELRDFIYNISIVLYKCTVNDEFDFLRY